MLIVNADDWGGWASATDAALDCFTLGRISSATAMMFMADSHRASAIGKAQGFDIGLHLNFSQPFSGNAPLSLRDRHERVCKFLQNKRYAVLLYNPFLAQDFDYVLKAQIEEFLRLYDSAPSHIDGHQHKHLCLNVLGQQLLPLGTPVRRNFSFSRGEKSLINRAYRALIDRWLSRRSRTTGYFFDLSQCLGNARLQRALSLSRDTHVELMVHPERPNENAYLTGEDWLARLKDVTLAPFKTAFPTPVAHSVSL